MLRRLRRIALTFGMLVGGLTAAQGGSALPEGRKTITLVGADGARLEIGHVTFTPRDTGATIAVALDAPEFRDEFLSMRPFRCLPHEKQMWCHLAYPYATKGSISAEDLADLEYALLFLHKPPAGYGIDAWNGLYFKLAPDGEGGLSGQLHEADFNVLAVPPDAATLRPIPHSALTPVATETHRFHRVEIR
jgi:hypothetical protein